MAPLIIKSLGNIYNVYSPKMSKVSQKIVLITHLKESFSTHLRTPQTLTRHMEVSYVRKCQERTSVQYEDITG